MARALPTLLVLALLGATAAAFALTESLKLEKTPIYRTHVGRPIPGQPNRTGLALFSPVCRCATDHVVVRFYLRKADRLTVWIERKGETVDTLVRDRRYGRGWVRLTWDGVQPTGIVVPDGDYTPVVHLAAEHRTIALPNPITVDTQAPAIDSTSVKPTVISPDADGKGDRLTVTYAFSEKGRATLLVGSHVAVRTRFPRTSGRLRWFGKIGTDTVPKGAYPLRLVVRDQAGNRTEPRALGTVTVRYVTLGRRLISAGPGERFYLRVSANAPVQWRLAGRTGRAKPGTIVLRAPKRVGTYRLFVSVAGHTATARVKVERIG